MTQLASDNSWALRRLKQWSWRSRWIILCTFEWRMAVSFESRVDRCILARPDWPWGLPPSQCCHHYAPNVVFWCLVARQLYPSCRFSSANNRCFQLSNPCWEIHSTAFMHHTHLTHRVLIRITSSCESFMILFNFYCYLGLDSFQR